MSADKSSEILNILQRDAIMGEVVKVDFGGEVGAFGISAMHPVHGEMGTSGLSAEDARWLYLARKRRLTTEPRLVIKVVDQTTGRVLDNPGSELGLAKA